MTVRPKYSKKIEPVEPFREITKGYLVVSSNGPVILTTNISRATKCFELYKQKDTKASFQTLTTHIERFKEIGRNLFTPIPTEYDNNIVDYRNKIVKEWHMLVSSVARSNPTIVWGKVAEKHGLKHKSAEEFNQWALDHMKYHKEMI